MQSKKVLAVIFGSIAVVTVVILHTFFQNGFFPIHDDTQIARVNQMTKALTDGVFPVRIVADLGYGYGYPLFNFYAPLAYYVGSFFDGIGFDELTSTKIMIGVSVFFLGVGMYLLSSAIFGKAGGLVSAFLALTSPYIALNIFVRGAVSELYGMTFIPWVFYFLIRISDSGKFRYTVLGSFAFAGIILSHNLTALISTPFIFVVMIFMVLLQQKSRIRIVSSFVKLIGFGLLISAFYWVPAVFEMHLSNVSGQIGGGADFRDHYICVPQLWESQWGYGGSVPGCTDGLSFRLGKLHILFVFLALLLLFLSRNRRVRSAIAIGLFVFFISFFFSLSQSKLFWQLSQVMEYIQYPWRYLGMMSLSAAFLAGSIVIAVPLLTKRLTFQKTAKLLLLIGVLIAVFVIYFKLFKPQSILERTNDSFVNDEILRYQTSSISDEYLPKEFKKPLDKTMIPSEPFSVIKGEAEISSKEIKTHSSKMRIIVGTETTILIHKSPFPFWKITLNDKYLPYRFADKGLIVDVPKGSHLLDIRYHNTPVQNIGNSLSLIGILAVIIGIIFEHRKKLL